MLPPNASPGSGGRGMPESATSRDFAVLTRQSTDAFNRRDFDGIMAMYSQNPVSDTSAVGLGVHEGREAVRAFHEDWQKAYEDFKGVVEDLRDLGNGVTITIFHQRATPHGGSGSVELRFALVTTWVDGRAERVTAYTDIDEARAAAQRLAMERKDA